ncbi:MAG: ATP-grasp domain-containing protein [Methanobrevibacter sp.]|jgi:predicted ATP-grasp superfamily ATP-dependent carboligase|nr:ATP-grasp domain-containing protein [Candidatus Methanovirga basalitermitum]
MDKLLILGINTRVVVTSATQLNYQTYSSSYYNTKDCNVAYKEKHALQQKPYQSCGLFEEKFNPIEILNQSSDWIEIVDYIILTTGISPNYFNGNIKPKNNENNLNVSELNKILKKNKKKIIGSKDTKNVENKYKFYKKMKNRYQLPLTFKLHDVYDTLDIIKQYNKMEFILKDVSGSGGYGINFLNIKPSPQFKDILFKLDKEYSKNKLILQEYIHGDNLSCSLLGSKNDSKAIIGNENIHNSYYQKNENRRDFRYSGSITPINQDKYNISNLKEIYNLSENMISDLNLIGSVGVDLILKDDKISIIEVNPRFQGTYECVEKVLGINLLEAHIKACDGDLIDISEPNNYFMKKIIYAPKRIKFNIGDLKNLSKNVAISDIPYENTIIEKDQPVLTLVSKNNKLYSLKRDIKKASYDINRIFNY